MDGCNVRYYPRTRFCPFSHLVFDVVHCMSDEVQYCNGFKVYCDQRWCIYMCVCPSTVAPPNPALPKRLQLAPSLECIGIENQILHLSLQISTLFFKNENCQTTNRWTDDGWSTPERLRKPIASCRQTSRRRPNGAGRSDERRCGCSMGPASRRSCLATRPARVKSEPVLYCSMGTLYEKQIMILYVCVLECLLFFLLLLWWRSR